MQERNDQFQSENLNPYFTAPELYSKNYSEKCDVWSLGVILYVLLSGFPPFSGQTEKQIQLQAKQGVFSLEGANWEHVGEKAKNLIRKMICLDVKQRYSAQEVIDDEWMQSKQFKSRVDQEQLLNCISNMKKFQVLSFSLR